MRKSLGIGLDGCLVVAFVLIGRVSHQAGGGFAGLVSTAWPFLTGLAVGEVAARGWRRPAAVAPTGVTAWLSTVAVGMTLRVIAGQGTTPAFVVVALAFLGLFLLGWRLAAAGIRALQERAALKPRSIGESP